MSVEKTKKVIQNFLSNTSPEVLSIKGKWGVGKTYFWKKIVQQTAQNLCCERYCYVSLFGIASLAELKTTICENLVDKTQIDKAFSVENLKQHTDKLVRQWGLWRSITKLRTVFSHVRAPINLEPLFFFLAFREVRNTLICIDDFERKGDELSTKEVLGLISQLKEERNCKIVLILNDINFDENSKQNFARFREKVVDVEVRFSPTPAESAALVFHPTSDIDSQLNEFTTALQISNIRILQRIRKAAYITVPLLREFDSQITRAALQTLTLFGWSYYSHAHDEQVPPYDYVTSFGYHFGDEKTEQQRSWNALLQEYGFKATDKLDVALSSVIENGFLDEDLVRAEANKLHQQIIATQSIDAFSEGWNIFYSFHEDDNEEKVVSTFASLLKKYVQYISPLNLNGVIELLRELGQDQLASELIDFYVTARSEDKKIFDYTGNMLPFGIKPDEELARKFDLQLTSLEETPTLANALAHIAQEQGWSAMQEEVLASATPDEFYRLFKSVTRKTLHSYIKAALRFGLWDNANDRHQAITKNAKKALRRLGSESLINKIRVKRYGISADEQPT